MNINIFIKILISFSILFMLTGCQTNNSEVKKVVEIPDMNITDQIDPIEPPINPTESPVNPTDSPVSSPLVAKAGNDQSVKTTNMVQLDGSASTGTSLTYKWRIISKPNDSSADLSSNEVEKPFFVADVNGTYNIGLIVDDGFTNSAEDTLIIVATDGNAKPMANAGPDQRVKPTEVVTLDGSSSSDADGDSLQYDWNLTVPSGSTASLSSTAAIKPTFTADINGTFSCTLIIYDGTHYSAADSVSIESVANEVPIVNTGASLY